ncbi:hypothetical protein SRHO_G00208750 [Serrasalmus rhombeus]
MEREKKRARDLQAPFDFGSAKLDLPWPSGYTPEIWTSRTSVPPQTITEMLPLAGRVLPREKGRLQSRPLERKAVVWPVCHSGFLKSCRILDCMEFLARIDSEKALGAQLTAARGRTSIRFTQGLCGR